MSQQKSGQRATFVPKPDGLYIKNGNTLRLLAPYINVWGIGSPSDCDAWVARIFFRNVNGVKRSIVVPKSLLKKAALVDRLEDAGYDAPADPNDLGLLRSYLAEARPKGRFVVVSQPGWAGSDYVFPKRVIRRSRKRYHFQSLDASRVANFDHRGNLKQWRKGVAEPSGYSTRLAFAISAALAAPLLKFVEVENGFFHFTDQSSIGKTLVVMVARSVCGLAERNSLFTWDFTQTGIEEAAIGHNYSILCLDELATLDPDPRTAAQVARRVAMKIAAGSRRLRSKSYDRQVGATDSRWRVLGLSSGEQSIGELANAAATERLRGEQLRLIDIPAQVHPTLGIFETLPEGYRNSKELVEAMERNCANYYGVAFPAFIEKVVENADTIAAEITTLMKEFNALAAVSGDSWEQRLAGRFALAFAAGIKGIEYGVLPWPRSIVEEACVSCYRGARSLVPDAERILVDGMERLVKGLTSKRVLGLTKTRNPTQEELRRAHGFKRKTDGQTVFGIKPKRFRQWFESDIQCQLVLQHLDSHGLLVRGATTLTKQQKYKGIAEKRRYYCIRASVLEAT